MAKSGKLAREILQLYFENVGVAGVGDATGLRGSATAGSLFLNLYSSSPGETGSGASPIAYVGYSEIESERDIETWMFGTGSESNVLELIWGHNTGHTTATARWWGVSRSAGGATDWYSPISPGRPKLFSVTSASLVLNRLVSPAHGLPNGRAVTFTSLDGSTFPTSHPTLNATYYAVNVTADDFQIAATVGGAALPLGSVGSGLVWWQSEIVIDRATCVRSLPGTIRLWPERPELTSPPPNGTLQNSVTAWGITITFEDAVTGGPVLVGEYLRTGSKKYWAYAPNGLRITGKTPAFENAGPQTSGGLSVSNWHKHGMMVSQSVKSTVQGLDSTIYMWGTINAPNYNQELNLARQLSLGNQVVVGHNGSANTVIAVRSMEAPFGRPQVYSMLCLMVVAAIPEIGAFRPCVGKNPLSTARPIPQYTVADIDYSRIPNLPIPADPNQLIPTWAKINGALDGEWYECPNLILGGSILKEYSRPLLHMTVDGSRVYGQDVGALWAACLAKVMLAYPQVEKEVAVQEMCQIALDTWQLSVWDRHNSTTETATYTGHWGEDAGNGCNPVSRILFGALLLHDQPMLDEIKLPAFSLAATRQWFHEHNQWFKVGEAGTGNYGRCGYGATPPGGANWTPDGTPDWGTAHRRETLDASLGGGAFSDEAAWDSTKQGNANYPKAATGVNCASIGNITQYRLCCTANILWIPDFYLRWCDAQGLVNYEDIFPPALGWYLRDQPEGRGYLQLNIAWGQQGEDETPGVRVTNGVNFFEVMRGPLGQVGVCKLVRYAYGKDYITYPLPPL